jgi:hypothetical protein
VDAHNWVWIKIGAAVAAIITFAYSNFETRDHARELLEHIIRIEEKVDKILETRR